MELLEFAKHILFEPELEAKLIVPDFLADENPKTSETLSDGVLPARSVGLGFCEKKNQKKFPGDFANPYARGLALHFFANHELLALELMALCLLKFPQAPSKFRLGLGRIMREEQAHMRLYLGRMKELGVRFGEIPVNGFFWSLTNNINSPFDFIARMSMTFEQANLDYSLYYLEKFRTVGDLQSSAIMQQVLDDEIGHVAHGVQWFKKWQDPQKDFWSAYTEALQFPLTPAHGKGIYFYEEPRRRSGLTDEFINEMKIFNVSKTCPQRIFLFNPQVEMEWGDSNLFLSDKIQRFSDDVGLLFGLLANHSDYFVGEKPDNEHLKMLTSLDFSLPEFLGADTFKARDRSDLEIVAWGKSPKMLNDSVDKTIFKKSFLVPLARDFCHKRTLEFKAEMVVNFQDVIEYAGRLIGYRGVVLKSMFGASGRGNIRLFFAENGDLEISDGHSHWIKIQLHKHSCLVIEPFYDIVMNFSHVGFVEKSNNVVSVKRQYFSRFKATLQGQYGGHYLGKKFFDLSTDVKRCLHQNLELLSPEILKNTAQWLSDAGYIGPFGIDGFLYRDVYGEIGVMPMVDLNVRYTFGHVAAMLEKKIASGKSAFLMVGLLSQFPKSRDIEMDKNGKFLSGNILLTEKKQNSKFGGMLLMTEKADPNINLDVVR